MNRKENKELLGALPMPRPLGDPLLFMRPILKTLYILLFALGTILMVVAVSSKQFELISEVGLLFLGGFVGLVFFIFAIPKFTTNAIYLRSFSKDSESKRIREYIEIVLGEEYRLSGIRDPRKRFPYILRPLLMSVLMLKYAGARFLNLEANDDWFARLWVSIGDSRLLFIDLRDITEFVKNEILLSATCMDLDRIIFIGDPGKSIDEWKSIVAETLNFSDDRKQDIQLTLWDQNKTENNEFLDDIKSMVDNTPEGLAGINWGAFDQVKSYIYTRSKVLKDRLLASSQVIAGIIILYFVSVEIESSGKFIKSLIFITLCLLIIYIVALSINVLRGKYHKRKLAKLVNENYAAVLNKEIKLSYIIFFMFLLSISIIGYGVYGKVGKLSDRATLLKAEMDIRMLKNVSQIYFIENDKYPSDDEGLRVLSSYTDGNMTDPWGNLYHYTNKTKYIIISSDGTDGVPGTQDDITSESGY